MNIKVCWMYHDIMDLYGDKGNIMVLKQRCLARNISFELKTCTIDEDFDLSSFNLVVIGGGADQEQRMISSDLIKRKANINKALESGTFFFLVCGGYQLFGEYYQDNNNNKIQGLGIYPFYTITVKNSARSTGNIVIEVALENIKTTIIGFENHGGQTMNVTTPFGKVLHGHGNNQEGVGEGYYDSKILGTYMHGPLLPKNPILADFIITKAIQKNSPSFKMSELSKLDDTYANKAQLQVLKNLNIRL